jgi:glycosyltransferase involved in cell wall biosynthesis
MVSCVVPVWNGERHLAETLDSILGQTLAPLEVIVADDGSTDGTAALVARYGRSITYVRQQNRGAPSARNLGLSIARGDFIAFLDADDLWRPDKLAVQMARFDSRPELEVSVTHLENFWSLDMAADERWCDTERRPSVVAGYSPSTIVARTETFAKVGRWDESIRHASTADWFVRARAAGVVMELLPDVLVRRRLHHANATRAHGSDSHDEHLRLVKGVIDASRRR